MMLWKTMAATAVVFVLFALPALAQDNAIDFAEREAQLASPSATGTRPMGSTIEIITVTSEAEPAAAPAAPPAENESVDAPANKPVAEKPVEPAAPENTSIEINTEAADSAAEEAPAPPESVEAAETVPAEPGDVESMEPVIEVTPVEPATEAVETETPEPEAAPAPQPAPSVKIVVENEVDLGEDKEETTPPRQPVPASSSPVRKAPVSDVITSGDDAVSSTASVIFPAAGNGVIFATGSSDLFGDLSAEASSGPKEISIENDFIKIVVNTMKVDTGRFLVRTVKGDPFRDTDDNKILIYGGAVPWTSFTTMKIDGENYVFGGPTNRRAGRGAMYGTCEAPDVVGDDTIITRCEIAGLEVTQALSIVGGPVSRLYDTMRINTVIRNPGMDSRRVGVRSVIDTLLGSNDGSPFKVGEESITTEQELRGMAIQDYWIAYDSLEDPGVVARGTLRGPGLTTPDRLVFANWGKLADNPWDIPYSPGQTFQRAGETGMDSAIALYWDETTIMPDGEIRYSTLYGIEYLNVAGDILSIGAQRNLGEWPTAKNRIKPYTVYAYAGNSSDMVLHNVLISLDLPDGVDFSGDDTGYRRLGTLEPGDEKTIGWTLTPRIGAGGDRVIRVVGTAAEVERVELETNVSLLPPPEIIPTVTAPEKIMRSKARDFGPYGPPFSIQVKCFNDGKYYADNLNVKLMLPDGLVFPRIQKAVQTFPRLNGQDNVIFYWKVIATGEESGPLEYKIIVESDSTEPKTLTGTIDVEPLPITASWTGVPDETLKGVFISAELYVTDIPELGAADFTIKYDPNVLDVIRISQGTLFVHNNQPLPWTDPKVDRKNGTVTVTALRESPLDDNEGSLLIVHFITRRPGETNLEITDGQFTNLGGTALNVATVPKKIVVK